MSSFVPKVTVPLRRITLKLPKRFHTSEIPKEGASDSKETIPPPSPPPQGLCCMSACQNCVWLQYAEDLTEYFKDGGQKAEEALNDITDANLKAFLKMELRMKK